MKPGRRADLLFLATSLALLSVGCKSTARHPATSTPASSSIDGAGVSVLAPIQTVGQAGAAPRPGSPLSQKELPTTSPSIALGNFEGDLANAASLVQKRPNDGEVLTTAALVYLQHGQIYGVLADYDRAAAFAARAVKLDPKVEGSWLALAGAHGVFHRFSEELVDVAQAEKLGASRYAVASRRASVDLALGELEKARLFYEKTAKDWPTLASLGALAALYADEGRLAEAEKLFIEAQHHYSDLAPYPVAWLWLEEGRMWEKAGRLARARELFEAALERVPVHAAVVSHLAAVESQSGDRPHAIERLRALIKQSDDPEYTAQLSEVLRLDDQIDEARRLRSDAEARYLKLLAAHPEAYADHAARFYLLPGGDVKKAFAWAQKNLGWRKSLDAHTLLAQAAMAAGDPAAACASMERALPLAKHSVALHNLAWKAFSACGKPERAATVLKTAEELAKEMPQ